MVTETEMKKIASNMGRGVSAELFEHEMETNSRILGRETGLQVVIGGEQAATDGKTIVLPALDHSKNVDSMAANVARGFVNHEASHLRHTNRQTMKRFAKHEQHNAFLQGMEDPRIEKAFSDKYAGAQRHFEAASNATLNRFVRQVDSGEIKIDDPQRLAPMLSAWEGRRKLGFDINEAPLEKLRKWAGTEVCELADKLSDVAIKADGTLAIANYLEKWLGKVEPVKEEEKEEDRRIKMGGMPGGTGGGEGESDAFGSGEGMPGGDDGGESGTPSIGADQEQPFTGMKARGFFDPSMADALQEMLPTGHRSAGYKSPLKYDTVWDDFDQYVKKACDEDFRLDYADANIALQYGISKDMTMLRNHGLAKIQHMNTTMGPAIRAMKMALERGLVIAKQRDWDPGQVHGNIDPKRLASVLTGTRNFYRKRAPINMVDTAVTLLVDMSGSMNGEKSIEAGKACYVFAEALTKVGIPIEVLGFSSDRKQFPNYHLYSRHGVIDIPVMKAFNDPYRASMWKVALFSNLTMNRDGGNNADGDSLVHAWRRLRTRPEPRKVLIVFSDGQPSTSGSGEEQSHLKRVVAQITMQGCQAFGIGIMSSAVQSYYPEYIVVNNAEELPVKAGSFLRQLMIPSHKRVGAARKVMKAA